MRCCHVGGNNPPIIVIHGNQVDNVPNSYRRFLEHKFMKAPKLEGTPIRLEFKTSANPFRNRRR